MKIEYFSKRAFREDSLSSADTYFIVKGHPVIVRQINDNANGNGF